METRDTLVSLHRLVLRRGLPCQHDPASGERRFGKPLPKPVRIAARRGLVVCRSSMCYGGCSTWLWVTC